MNVRTKVRSIPQQHIGLVHKTALHIKARLPDHGEVIVEPSEHVLAEYQRAIDDAAILEMDLEQVEAGTAVTSDGQHVHLMLNAGDAEREDEHNVSLTKGFYLGKYEVTQAQVEPRCTLGLGIGNVS